MKYEFDFSTMTIGDCTALTDAVASDDMHRAALIVDKFFVGGFLNLPLFEMANAMRQFNAALDEWYAGRNVDESAVN